MQFKQSSDANFFALINHLIESKESEQTAEQRNAGRHSYECVQFVAPYRDGNLPGAGEFTPITCHDLSATGFSYFAPQPATEEYLVAALGSPPSIYLLTEVMHSTPKHVDGKIDYLIGCRFISRVTKPEFCRFG